MGIQASLPPDPGRIGGPPPGLYDGPPRTRTPRHAPHPDDAHGHPPDRHRRTQAKPLQPLDLRRLHPRRSTTSSRASATTGSSSPWWSPPRRGLGGPLRPPPAGLRPALGLPEVPCEVRTLRSRAARRRAVLEYNRQRRKTFSQLMREADALESLARGRGATPADRQPPPVPRRALADRRDSDDRGGRTDATIAQALGLGGKDLYRQARAIWRAAQAGDPRAERPGPARRRDQDDPRGLQRPDAAATASPPASARPPTTSGRSGTTAPSASPTPARSRRPSSPTLLHYYTAPAPWSSTRWPAAGRRSTSARPWDAAASRMTSIPCVPISRHTT